MRLQNLIILRKESKLEKQGCLKILHHIAPILKLRSYRLPKDLLARRAQVPIWCHFLPLDCPKLDLIPNIGRNLHAKFKVEVEKNENLRILEAKMCR